jgi:hypothetical protein
MLIALGESAWHRPKGLHRSLRGLVNDRQHTAGGAGNTVSGVVGVVRAGARGFDVRTRVRAELPFRQRRKRQQYLSSDQKTNRQPQQYRFQTAGGAYTRHHR